MFDNRNNLLIFLTICLALSLRLGGDTITEDFTVSPGDSGNGWVALQPEFMLRPPSGPLTINAIGAGPATPQYRLDNGPNLSVEWLHAEMVVIVWETEDATDPRSSFATAVWVSNSSYEYVMGVRVRDLGAGVYETNVDLFDSLGPSPTHLGSFTLADTAVNSHKYTCHLDPNTGTISVDVDAVSLGTAKVSGSAGPASGIGLRFGDLRGSWSNPTIEPNSDTIWQSVTFSTTPLLAPAAPPQCGDQNTTFLPVDVSGPGGTPDCYVDIYDLVVLVNEWLICTDPLEPACDVYWN